MIVITNESWWFKVLKGICGMSFVASFTLLLGDIAGKGDFGLYAFYSSIITIVSVVLIFVLMPKANLKGGIIHAGTRFLR
ncbi:MAG: hypothetical protein ACTSQY_06315 [Candidatus Odinarchaeia archaeon]